ncbi:MAG TPA: RNA pseudouridine synthase [Chitinophagaceae bacterium]|nr:RNA pseudouridine synthase [Chitinophagaceae bacterium]
MPSWNLEKSIITLTEEYVAVNKPSGMLSIPDRFNANLPSLSALLHKKYPEIYIVHRLDRETSGLILFARNKEAHRYLSQCFESRRLVKYYLALVNGKMAEPAGKIDLPLIEHPAGNGKMIIAKKGKPAITEYTVLEDYSLFSLLQVRIHTGRTHQIRVHLQTTGHPIACDSLYGKGSPILLSSFKHNYRSARDQEAEKPLLSRLALHSSQLIFTDPQGREVNLKAPLSRDMNALIQQLGKYSSRP